MKDQESETNGLLSHYSNEVCSHVEASIGLFFGIVGTLFILDRVENFYALIVFSVLYLLIGALGTYFFIRLFYYRKLLEEILLSKPYKEKHRNLKKQVLKHSRLIKLTDLISRTREGEYRLTWAWTMLALAGIAATLSWIVVVLT